MSYCFLLVFFFFFFFSFFFLFFFPGAAIEALNDLQSEAYLKGVSLILNQCSLSQPSVPQISFQ